jgi:cytochrome c
MRRLLLALPLVLAACGPKPAEAPADAPAEAPAAAPAPAPATTATAAEAPAAAPTPAPAPAVEPAKAAPAPAPAKAAPAPAPAPTPVATADLANGQKQFLRCRACHTLVAGGANGVGPNLHGLFGRKAASVAGYNYSPALAAADFSWSAARLDPWIADPKAMVPGNKMVFPGLKDAKDRADLIAYLQAETR